MSGGAVRETQWWLAELDQYGNPTLCDGAHSERQGAEHALYLFQRLGFAKDRRFAVAEVRLTNATPNPKGVDEEALAALNAIGLRPSTPADPRGGHGREGAADARGTRGGEG